MGAPPCTYFDPSFSGFTSLKIPHLLKKSKRVDMFWCIRMQEEGPSLSLWCPWCPRGHEISRSLVNITMGEQLKVGFLDVDGECNSSELCL